MILDPVTIRPLNVKEANNCASLSQILSIKFVILKAQSLYTLSCTFVVYIQSKSFRDGTVDFLVPTNYHNLVGRITPLRKRTVVVLRAHTPFELSLTYCGRTNRSHCIWTVPWHKSKKVVFALKSSTLCANNNVRERSLTNWKRPLTVGLTNFNVYQRVSTNVKISLNAERTLQLIRHSVNAA